MARKKSIKDFRDQLKRMYDTAMSKGKEGADGFKTISPEDNQRMLKAFDIAQRYQDNINKTKSTQKTKKKWMEAGSRKDMGGMLDAEYEYTHRQYSRNTYMGKNNG